MSERVNKGGREGGAGGREGHSAKESEEEGGPRGKEQGSTSARIAERCATAAPDTSFAWNVYQHRRWLIIIPRARMHALSPVRSFAGSFVLS